MWIGTPLRNGYHSALCVWRASGCCSWLGVRWLLSFDLVVGAPWRRRWRVLVQLLMPHGLASLQAVPVWLLPRQRKHRPACLTPSHNHSRVVKVCSKPTLHFSVAHSTRSSGASPGFRWGGVAALAESHTRAQRASPWGGPGACSMLPRKSLNFSMPEMANLTLFAIETTGNKNSDGPCLMFFFLEQINVNVQTSRCYVPREGTSMQKAVRLMTAFAWNFKLRKTSGSLCVFSSTSRALLCRGRAKPLV